MNRHHAVFVRKDIDHSEYQTDGGRALKVKRHVAVLEAVCVTLGSVLILKAQHVGAPDAA